MNKFCLVVSEMGEAPSLMRLLALDGAEVAVLAVGERALADEAARCAESVKWLDTNGDAAENYADSAAEAVAALGAAANIAVSAGLGRIAVAKAAAMSAAPLVPNALSVTVENDGVRVEHAVYSDKMLETLTAPKGVGLLVNPFVLQTVDMADAPALCAAERITGDSRGFVELVSHSAVAASRMQTADIVVGVGLGASGEGAFAAAGALAQKLGAELGCSMPVYNELGLLPHENYIGVSGSKIAPKLYLALGVSGTSQHCAGVRNAKTIVCVNKDPKALIFDNADYGIVGDVNEVLPALVDALK